jgi:hypothetical protein
MTEWRLLNTTVLFVLGMAKAVSTDLGYSTTPTLDWIVGVMWTQNHWVEIVKRYCSSHVGHDKAVSAYLGYSTTPTTLDWVVGIMWTLMYVPYYKVVTAALSFD